jgi:uncharacterized membrane protein (DUF373 family)
MPGRETTGTLFDQAIRILLCFLLLAILGSIAAGVARALVDTWNAMAGVFFGGPLSHSLEAVLIDALGVLAMVEVYRTAMAYFIEGRVKVTYIIDTVLVALLTETLAFWYREVETSRTGLLLALVAVLMVMRILAISFSPNRRAVANGL